jgi:hypothetical protein
VPSSAAYVYFIQFFYCVGEARHAAAVRVKAAQDADQGRAKRI